MSESGWIDCLWYDQYILHWVSGIVQWVYRSNLVPRTKMLRTVRLLTPSMIRPWGSTITVNNGLATSTDEPTKSPIKKSVFISQSHDVFTNLALEDWIYRNYNFEKHHVLMLWINDPCVVIGRHQNPFSEANISELLRKGIALARRNSGGGTVYHDSGNLNCTFFTARERYNRRYNLNLITRALFREWSIKAEISDRDDILLRGKKVWGRSRSRGSDLCAPTTASTNDIISFRYRVRQLNWDNPTPTTTAPCWWIRTKRTLESL